MQPDTSLDAIRQTVRNAYTADETTSVNALVSSIALSKEQREAMSELAADLVRDLRANTKPSLMENFLAQYGLSNPEGVALMCLAEALLRVPDSETIDALIADKITANQWSLHLGGSSSSLVNASTWALLLTGKVLAQEHKGVAGTVRSMVKRLGEPVVRTAVAQAMKELGRQFVLGRTIEEAQQNGADNESQGFTHSYDMLGEAALTGEDARRYHKSYSDAIAAIASTIKSADPRDNAGISVKLSALHPRYEYAKKERVLNELVPATLSLMQQAKEAHMGFNIDAEEAERLDLSLDVIEALMADPSLEGWEGFGIVVQAFGPRAFHVIDWLYALAQKYDRKIMIRLVKGAYWDTEIKRAQVLGLDGYPVFTRKLNSDIAYMACAQKLLGMVDRIYPQFATHNAQSMASILKMATALPTSSYEFQRLHGMGEALHETVAHRFNTRCRIYAPVGAHKDLLAYLVRRLLENGANSSFVNQIRNAGVEPEQVAGDPLEALEGLIEAGKPVYNENIPLPKNLYGTKRANAKGWDLSDYDQRTAYLAAQERFKTKRWQAAPLIAGRVEGAATHQTHNPAVPQDCTGQVQNASANDLETALSAAATSSWQITATTERAAALNRFANLLEENSDEIFVLLTREAGKTYMDAIGELREAVDFARFYAQNILQLEQSGQQITPRGVSACISPWNFPLAIFCGQILAGLAAGNPVLAKPAEQTPLIAHLAVSLMHKAGIARDAVQLLIGPGSVIGAALTSDPRVKAVTFTGSTPTAHRINRTMATHLSPCAPLIAETGGLNAMIVDSTALPEQAVQDIIASSFQSAGQRCSALRMLYVQEDIYPAFKQMLFGAMDELEQGSPQNLSVDVGPVIDAASQQKIMAHCKHWQDKGHLLKQLPKPEYGTFVPPTLIELRGIEELEEEIFGPVLHIAPYKAKDLDKVLDAINAKGFGLTFGLHTRVDKRVQHIVDRIQAGNIYVNRNQIGAIVGSQPFGGEGMSGTGPKAGGPHYVSRLLAPSPNAPITGNGEEKHLGTASLQFALAELDSSQWQSSHRRFKGLARVFPKYKGQIEILKDQCAQQMPGPTGESNRLTNVPRGKVLCLGPDKTSLEQQAVLALAGGNAALLVGEGAQSVSQTLQHLGAPASGLEGAISASCLSRLKGFDAVASFSTDELKAQRIALAQREGPILPLICEQNQPERYQLERHLCVDTTAAGGNTSLLAASEDS